MSIGQIHDVRQTTSVAVCQADAVLQDDVVGVVLPQDRMDLLRARLGVHLIHVLGPVPQVLVFKVRVVGDGSVGAQLHSRHQLHGAADDGVLVSLLLQPLHEVHRVRVIELPELRHLLLVSGQTVSVQSVRVIKLTSVCVC